MYSKSLVTLTIGLVHTLLMGKMTDYMGWDWSAILFQVLYTVCLFNIVSIVLKFETAQDMFSVPDAKQGSLMSYIYTN